MDKKIYLDNASTTYVSSEVLNEMIPCFNTIYGNSNSLHSFGRDAQAMVDRARDKISKAINSKSDEIYFTSGGTEANNWAIKGLAMANKSKGKHIIVSKIEHDSVLESCKQLEKEGFEVTYLNCNSEGLVSVAELLHYIRNDTILVSIMTVNNEVGTIQSIKSLASVAHDKGAIFHTDAVQAIGHVKIDVKDMGIDAMTMSAHKIHGPKGVGALYVKNGLSINNLIQGGTQEKGKRGGTVNVPNVVGFGKAVEIATRDLIPNNQKLKTIRDYFVRNINEKIPYIHINGHQYQKVNNILNVSFEMVEGESVVMMLDLNGVAVSTGSACATGSLKTSHVLKAMNLGEEYEKSAIRFSFSKSTTKEDVDYVVETLVKVIEKLRSMSPITKTGRAK